MSEKKILVCDGCGKLIEGLESRRGYFYRLGRIEKKLIGVDMEQIRNKARVSDKDFCGLGCLCKWADMMSVLSDGWKVDLEGERIEEELVNKIEDRRGEDNDKVVVEYRKKLEEENG